MLTLTTTTPALADDTGLHITANLSTNATAITMGETILRATTDGYPASRVINSPIAKGLNVYPLLNTCTITQITSAILLKDINLTSATNIYSLLANPAGGWTSYSDITINLSGGIHAIGSEHETISLTTYANYGLTTITTFPIQNTTPGRSWRRW